MKANFLLICAILFFQHTLDATHKALKTSVYAAQKRLKKKPKTLKKTLAQQAKILARFNKLKKVLENKKASIEKRLHAAKDLQATLKQIQSDEFISRARGLSLRKVNNKPLRIPTPKRLDKKTKQQIKRSLTAMQIELKNWINYLQQTNFKIKKNILENKRAPLVNRLQAAKDLQEMLKQMHHDTRIADARGLSLHKVDTKKITIPAPKKINKKTKQQIKRSLDSMQLALKIWEKHLQHEIRKQTKSSAVVSPIPPFRPAPSLGPTTPPVTPAMAPMPAPIRPAPHPTPARETPVVHPTIYRTEAAPENCQFCGSVGNLFQLSCGHTFCRDCLAIIINEQEHPRCPTCNQLISEPDIEAIRNRWPGIPARAVVIEHEEPAPEPIPDPIPAPRPEPTRQPVAEHPTQPPEPAARPATPIPLEAGECPVCFSDAVYRLSCGHHICPDCLRRTIDVAVDTANNIDQLRCPNCRTPLSRADIETVYPEKLAAIDRLAHAQWMLRNADRIGQCPTPDCPYLFAKRRGNRQIIRCPECHQEFCSRCLERHPANTRCHQDERLPEGVRRCPKCDLIREREGGCDWWRCPCGQAFCIGCGQTNEHIGPDGKAGFHHYFPCRSPNQIIPPDSLPLTGADAIPVSPPALNQLDIPYGEPGPDIDRLAAGTR